MISVFPYETHTTLKHWGGAGGGAPKSCLTSGPFTLGPQNTFTTVSFPCPFYFLDKGK